MWQGENGVIEVLSIKVGLTYQSFDSSCPHLLPHRVIHCLSLLVFPSLCEYANKSYRMVTSLSPAPTLQEG